MGCTCCKDPRSQKGASRPQRDEVQVQSGRWEVQVVEREPPKLCFNVEEIDAFGDEYRTSTENQALAAMRQELEDFQVTETHEREQLRLEEDTEHGYLTFELEEQWDQAKLEDDLRRGVIPVDRFVVPHREEFLDYSPPFVSASPPPLPPIRDALTPMSMDSFTLPPSRQPNPGSTAPGLTQTESQTAFVDEFGEQLGRKASISSAQRYAAVLDNDDALSDDNTAVLTVFRSAMGGAPKRNDDAMPELGDDDDEEVVNANNPNDDDLPLPDDSLVHWFNGRQFVTPPKAGADAGAPPEKQPSNGRLKHQNSLSLSSP